ncbi:MAG TPA: hypothetical protein GX695_02095, partial [Acholeplasmataceae bacterium]|nr:hypothetical protein [Acholeplasmataceae bacterium]
MIHGVKNKIFSLNLSIYAKKLLFVFIVMMTLVLVSGCDKTIKVTGVNLNQEDVTVDVGEVINVQATVLPSDATEKTVTWSSSEPMIVKVESGKVTALAVGEATITAKAGNFEASFKVTVVLAKVTITFANTNLESISINKGAKLTVPAVPTKSGFTFDNWYADSGLSILFNFDEEIEEDLTIYANFDKDGYNVVLANTDLEDVFIEDGSKLENPGDPVKEGHNFAGWWIDSQFTTLYDFDSLVTEDLTIYAKFSL